jgi:hypothetical protein
VAKKITDYDFSLPIIEALIPHKTSSKGQNKAFLISGVCQNTHVKDDYVVKFWNSQAMSVEASCREMLASFMALQLDLPVSVPSLVNISPPFVETLKGQESYINASESLGLNVGSQYSEGYFELIKNQTLSDSQRLQMNQIFPFDIFISNVVRKAESPNLLTDGSSLLMFNHQSAFDFMGDGYKNKTPWEFRPQDIDWIRNHLFFPYLKNKFPDFSILVNKLSQLDDRFWQKAFSLIPNEWKTDELEEIKTHSQAIIAHKDLFLQSLKNVLFK